MLGKLYEVSLNLNQLGALLTLILPGHDFQNEFIDS